MGLCVEADDGFEDAEIVHELHERDKGDQRHQMGHDHVADPLEARCAIDWAAAIWSKGSVCSPA